jgi:hypothetical protein
MSSNDACMSGIEVFSFQEDTYVLLDFVKGIKSEEKIHALFSVIIAILNKTQSLIECGYTDELSKGLSQVMHEEDLRFVPRVECILLFVQELL